MDETSTALDTVAAFEFYLSKTHPDYKALFQTPNKATSKNINFASARHSYRNEPLGKNIVSKMMGRISIKAELSERYTNAFVHRLSLLGCCAVWTQGKSVQSQSTKMNGAFPST